MVTLVVIRVVYVNDVAVSISVPTLFTGDTAAIDASSYVRKNVQCPANKDIKDRVEYQVVPAGTGAARLDRWSSLEATNDQKSHVRLVGIEKLRKQSS